MKLAATIARSLQADMQAELSDIERAVASGTREAGRSLRTELCQQVTSAGLGQRLANSWRDNHYPNRKLDPASLFYTKAPHIIRSFDEGAVIRSRRGRFAPWSKTGSPPATATTPTARRCSSVRSERVSARSSQLAAIDAALYATLAADPALQARFDILVSIPGVGQTTALAWLVEMPELGTLEHRCAASLAGLAPMARDSGQHRGKRFIRGGRAHLRQALYMPALVAVRFNPTMKAKYQALRAAGKAPKVALTAIMRKLLILANALLRDGRTWSPTPA
jgi:transposase